MPDILQVPLFRRHSLYEDGMDSNLRLRMGGMQNKPVRNGISQLLQFLDALTGKKFVDIRLVCPQPGSTRLPNRIDRTGLYMSCPHLFIMASIPGLWLVPP